MSAAAINIYITTEMTLKPENPSDTSLKEVDSSYSAHDKPSRSEIEHSVSSRKKKRRKPHKSNRNSEFQLNSVPRRQQVIGGNLTGVSKRPKYGIFSRYSRFSIFNWIAGVMVILILAAFFWPQGGESTREVVNKLTQVKPNSIYTESRVDAPPVEASPSKSFGRETDIERASTFRAVEAQEQQIKVLLSQANTHVEKGAYTQPENNNAVTVYQQILKISPSNRPALKGLEYINSRFLRTGYKALDQNNGTLANNVLDKLGIISTESEQYLELSSAIVSWNIDSKINTLIENAENATLDERLVSPKNENALYFYRQILEIDGVNQLALSGIENIAQTYFTLAKKASTPSKYNTAIQHLAIASKIAPEDESIEVIEKLINKARSKAQRSKRQAAIERAKQDALATGKTPEQEAREQAAFDKQYLDRGLQAYYEGDYKSATALLQPLADKGISRAQFKIGYMHYLGRGFKRNRREAIKVIRAALPAIEKFAKEGRGWAQTNLGNLYEEGLAVSRSYREALKWYRAAAEQGYPRAQTNLGLMYARGRGVGVNRRIAIEWLQRAAKQGDQFAQQNLESLGIR